MPKSEPIVRPPGPRSARRVSRPKGTAKRRGQGIELRCSWGIAAGYVALFTAAYEFLFRPVLHWVFGFLWK